MVGHLTLYRSVLHHPDNTLPLWFLEAVGVYTSLLNECEYSFTHHCANMRRLLKDDKRADNIESALRNKSPEKSFSGKELALIRYTGKLTSTPVRWKPPMWKLPNHSEQLMEKFLKSIRSVHTSATLTAPLMVLESRYQAILWGTMRSKSLKLFHQQFPPLGTTKL